MFILWVRCATSRHVPGDRLDVTGRGKQQPWRRRCAAPGAASLIWYIIPSRWNRGGSTLASSISTGEMPPAASGAGVDSQVHPQRPSGQGDQRQHPAAVPLTQQKRPLMEFHDMARDGQGPFLRRPGAGILGVGLFRGERIQAAALSPVRPARVAVPGCRGAPESASPLSDRV